MMLLWTLWGCDAALLKVQLPPRGIESISAEDLQRDVWAQLNPESELDHEDWLRHRFRQHQSKLDYQDTIQFCAQQEDPQIGLWVKPRQEAQVPYWTAILLSAAKGLEPELEGQFCLGHAPSAEQVVDLQEILVFHQSLPSERWQPELIHYDELAAELRRCLKAL